MAERRTRDLDELRGASDSLIYEYWMLKGLADLLGRGDFVEDRLVRNAVLESFLIHARASVDFFHVGPDKRPKKDDAMLGHDPEVATGKQVPALLDVQWLWTPACIEGGG